MINSDDTLAARSFLKGYSPLRCESALRALVCRELSESAPCFGEASSARRYINEYVIEHYPNETTIKSAFVNEVLLKQGQSNVVVFELPVNGSRVDLCKVNGSSYAFEIKTDLDSLARLEKQLADYGKVFEHVCIIVSEARAESLPNYVNECCGIYTYRKINRGRYSFDLRRAPRRSVHLDPCEQLAAIPKGAVRRLFPHEASICDGGSLVEAIAKSRSRDDVNKMFKRYVKDRYREQWGFLKREIERICDIDYSWFFQNNLDPGKVYLG